MTSLLPNEKHEREIVGNKKKLTMINWLVCDFKLHFIKCFFNALTLSAGEVASEEILTKRNFNSGMLRSQVETAFALCSVLRIELKVNSSKEEWKTLRGPAINFGFDDRRRHF
jgi:hypothetical protein